MADSTDMRDTMGTKLPDSGIEASDYDSVMGEVERTVIPEPNPEGLPEHTTEESGREGPVTEDIVTEDPKPEGPQEPGSEDYDEHTTEHHQEPTNKSHEESATQNNDEPVQHDEDSAIQYDKEPASQNDDDEPASQNDDEPIYHDNESIHHDSESVHRNDESVHPDEESVIPHNEEPATEEYEQPTTEDHEESTIEDYEQSATENRDEPTSDSEIIQEYEQESIVDSVEGDDVQVLDVLAYPEVDAEIPDVLEKPQQRDESPLFEPEHGQQHEQSSRITPEQTPTPSLAVRPVTPTTRPIVGGNSTFSKIRNLQRRFQQSKAVESQASRLILRQYQSTPDPETLLESILPKSTPNLLTEKATVVEDDDDEKKKKAEFQKAQKFYSNLKETNGGHLSFRQDVEWMKIKGAEDARQKKRKRDEALARADQDGDQEDLFPNDDINANDPDHDNGLDMGNQSGSRKRRRPELPQKEPKQMSMRDAEMKSMMVALEANGDMPKKKRNGQSEPDDSQNIGGSAQKKGSKSKVSKPSRSKTSGKKSAKATRKTTKDKRKTQNAVQQVSSLFTSNVFEQQARQDAPEQPTFRSRNKQDALKELIASVPFENRKVARGDMGALVAATKDFDGYGSVKADGNSMWLVKGMKTSLKPYQLLGSAFMRRRENSIEEPRGGLVADQMGLGKTLVALANIVNGRRHKGEKGPKTTLLVAGQNLLNQWAKEIDTHTDGSLTVMKYSSGNRLDSNICMEVLQKHDIILTTYTEIMRSYPKNEPPIECQTAEEKIAWWKEVYENDRGVLHRMLFQRIVLDEAQAIKNHTSRTSIACRALMAEHRWALSGTPILNALTELYPYFKFLNVPHTGSFKIFKNNYCDASDVENTERLLVRLSQFMIRRTHADEMFGAPILKLPKADQATHWCDFNPVERNIYDIVRERFAKNINIWAKKGELEKSYSNALVMLLRLRQLTAHVLMLQFVMRDLLEREDIERIREVVREAATNNQPGSGHTIAAIRKQLDSLAAEEKKKSAKKAAMAAKAKRGATNPNPRGQTDILAEDDALPPSEDEDENENQDAETLADDHQQADRVRSGKAFGKEYDFNPYLRSLTVGESWEKAKKKAMCGSCGKKPRYPFITACKHLYCQHCCEEMFFIAAQAGTESPTCKKCGQVFRYSHPCDAEGEPEGFSGPETRSSTQKRQEKERIRPEREDIKDDWLSLGAGGSVLPSAKTIAIKAQILNWVHENPDVKIIVYTQFLPMIRILAKVCSEEGWPTEQYHGKLNYNARDKAIGSFADNPNIRVLLASLRCGGLGLNLTMASRVIVVDPWWNNASEQQAFCRVFRIGQKETTFMTRFCVKDTVDKRLIEMQEYKKEEIDSVMEDKTTMSKIGIKDLMRLFGNLDEDEAGRPFIVVDNPDPKGGFRADKDHEGFADDF